MAAANRNDRFPSARSNPTPPSKRLAERVRHYFDRHPEEADLALWDGQPMNTPLRRGMETTLRWRRPPSAEEIRLHAWLAERLTALHHERHGFWPKLRRLIFENRLARWLRLRGHR